MIKKDYIFSARKAATTQINELKKIKDASKLAFDYDIEVHAGHGLDYKTTKILRKIPYIKEFNIGHFSIGESLESGMPSIIKEFKKIVR